MRRAVSSLVVLLSLAPRFARGQVPEEPPRPRSASRPAGAGLKRQSGGRASELPSFLLPTPRARGPVRPLSGTSGRTGSSVIADLLRYLARAPLRLSLASSATLASPPGEGNAVVTRLRDYVGFGGPVGTRLRGFGTAGLAMAGFLRLGALDGLSLTLAYAYVPGVNLYTGGPAIRPSNILPTLDLPFSPRTTLFAMGGITPDKWIYSSVGLRYRVAGDGGPGSWFLSGSLGAAWVDRSACPSPGATGCMGTARALGPTVGASLERRF